MKIIRRSILPGKTGSLFLLVFSICVFSLPGKCQTDSITAKGKEATGELSRAEIEKKMQEQQVSSWQSQTKQIVGILPTFFEKDSTVGSPYLASGWMKGILELSDHSRVPKPNEFLFFNYDKIRRQLISVNAENKIEPYPMNSVLAFALIDGDKIYLFEKVYFISKDFFLEPVLKSEKGYSLYKRLITKLNKADFRSEGYYSTGQKFDEYEDDYEYYLLSPDKREYKKFYLKETAIRKVFKDQGNLLDDLLKKPVSEKELISVVEAVNSTFSGMH